MSVEEPLKGSPARRQVKRWEVGAENLSCVKAVADERSCVHSRTERGAPFNAKAKITNPPNTGSSRSE
jgi:hypothetical protein